MTIYNDLYGYVYKITNNLTKEFYFGSRTSTISQKIIPERDLWILYFTSSTIISEQIATFGAKSFTSEILFKSNNSDLIFWTEQNYIKAHIEEPGCLNLHYLDKDLGHKIFSTCGKTPWNKGLQSPARGVARSQETIELMSLNRKGKNVGQVPWNKGKVNVYSKDALARLSKSASEKTGDKNPFYGKTHTEETKSILRQLQKQIVTCPHCNKSGGITIMKRWHFNNCKKGT